MSTWHAINLITGCTFWKLTGFLFIIPNANENSVLTHDLLWTPATHQSGSTSHHMTSAGTGTSTCVNVNSSAKLIHLQLQHAMCNIHARSKPAANQCYWMLVKSNIHCISTLSRPADYRCQLVKCKKVHSVWKMSIPEYLWVDRKNALLHPLQMAILGVDDSSL